ncbi:hypothetical protein [Halobellus marinus]|nr:hypothetical protein [Halobellus sp. DFY28]
MIAVILAYDLVEVRELIRVVSAATLATMLLLVPIQLVVLAVLAG